MDETTQAAFIAVIPIYLIIACGWVARAAKWVSIEQDHALMKLGIELCYPCLIFSSLFGNDLLRSPIYVLQAGGLGMLTIFLGLGVAYGVARFLNLSVGNGLRTFTLSAGIQNYVFFVLPVILVLFPAAGDPMVGILLTFSVGCEVAIWTVGVLVMSGDIKTLTPKLFLRGPLIATAVALVLIWTHADTYITAIPGISKALSMLGACAVPLFLLIFGASMRDAWGKVAWQPRLLLGGIITRLGIVPALILLTAWVLPLDIELKRLLVFQSALPAAIVPVVMAKLFGGQPGLAIQIVIVTTIISFLTLPLWLSFGFKFIAPM